MMAPILQQHGVPAVLYICGAVSVLGIFLTVPCIKETQGKSLEEVTQQQTLGNDYATLDDSNRPIITLENEENYQN